MIRLTLKRLDDLHHAYREQKTNARVRGIGFHLTFQQWLDIWISSGHLLERGCQRGMYCMARFGDRGPYRIGNVEIILHAENSAQANRGKIVSKATRKKLSDAWDRRRLDALIALVDANA